MARFNDTSSKLNLIARNFPTFFPCHKFFFVCAASRLGEIEMSANIVKINSENRAWNVTESN